MSDPEPAFGHHIADRSRNGDLLGLRRGFALAPQSGEDQASVTAIQAKIQNSQGARTPELSSRNAAQVWSIDHGCHAIRTLLRGHVQGVHGQGTPADAWLIKVIRAADT